MLLLALSLLPILALPSLQGTEGAVQTAAPTTAPTTAPATPVAAPATLPRSSVPLPQPNVPGAPHAPTATLTYSHPQTQPTSFTLILHEDGTGHFHSEPLRSLPMDPGVPPATSLDTDIRLARLLTDKFFEIARSAKVKAGNCDDAGTKIAFQGTKRLIYEDPHGRQECEFNWSRTRQIQELTEQLQAVAETLELGRRLDAEHLHDRLGLDAELELLTREVAEGHAIELDNIAGKLRELADDPAVLDRVRRRATALLAPPK